MNSLYERFERTASQFLIGMLCVTRKARQILPLHSLAEFFRIDRMVRASQFKLFSLLILVLQMACARKQDANEPVRAPLTQLSCGRSSKIQGESSSLALSEISAKILVDEKPSQVGVGCKKIPAEIEGFLKIYSNFANHTTYLLTDVSGKKFKLLPPANHFSVWHTGDWIQVQGERFECPAKSTFDVL